MSNILSKDKVVLNAKADSKSEAIRMAESACAGRPLDFGGDEPAFIVIGIAVAGGDHMEILTNVAMIFTDDEH